MQDLSSEIQSEWRGPQNNSTVAQEEGRNAGELNVLLEAQLSLCGADHSIFLRPRILIYDVGIAITHLTGCEG